VERRADLRRWLPWLAVAGYAVALALLLARHEPWRDEIQAWLLARDSPTLGDLWRNTRYEGHPLLWHLLLWLLARFTHDPAAMQVLHFAIATAAAAALSSAASLPVWFRTLWLFSYLPLYEHGAISRNYALTNLGLLLAVRFAPAPGEATLALAAAANASPMGVLLVPPLAWALWPPGTRPKRAWLAFLAVAWGFALVSCLPPPDYEHARGLVLRWDTFRAYYVARGLAGALFPFFRFELHFWNNPAILPFEPSLGLLLVALGLVAGAVALETAALVPTARLVPPFLAGTGILLAFFYAKFPGAMRHHAYFPLWLLLFAWLRRQTTEERSRGELALMAAMLCTGLQGAAVAAWVDWREPFSAGKSAASSLSSTCSPFPLLGHPDWAASTIAGFLPGRSIYYPARRSWGTFVVWDLYRAQREALTDEQLLRELQVIGKGREVCLALNRPFQGGGGCRLLGQLPTSIVADEAYWLYRCRAD